MNGISAIIAETCLTRAGAVIGAEGCVAMCAVAQREQRAWLMSLNEWLWDTSTTPPKMTNATEQIARRIFQRAGLRRCISWHNITLTIPEGGVRLQRQRPLLP